MIPARIVLAAGLAAASAASAHSELHSAEWCAGGFVHYRGEFTFTAEQLQAETRRRATQRCASGVTPGTGAPPDIGSPTSTCGVFDPPYETAVMMARGACGGGSPPGSGSDDGSTVAFVSWPESFNDAGHHDTFDFSQGLQGMCGVCLMPSGPADPVYPVLPIEAGPRPGTPAPTLPPHN